MRFVSRQDHSLSDDSPSSQCEPHFGSFYSDPIHSAVPLVASLVSLPSAAGTAHLLDLLPPHLSSVYADPQLLLRSAPTKCKVRPRVLQSSRSEYVNLVKRLHALGMVCFRTSVRVVNGIFAVRKSGGTLRLIIDARPANAAFTEPDHVVLPTPDLIARLQAPPGSPIFAAKVDLDNFYHRIRLPEWMREFFGLPPLMSDEMGLPGDPQQIYPCCTTLPMGWSHSVLVAQDS